MIRYRIEGPVRHLPDPVFKGAGHYFFFLSASEARKFAEPVPREANVRASDRLNRAPWKKLKSSFKNNDHFHLMNRGGRIIADSARRLTVEKDGVEGIEFLIDPAGRQGILDGGHSLSIFEGSDDGEQRYMLCNVTVNPPSSVSVAEMAEGLNSGVAVEDWTISTAAGDFDKIQHIMKQAKTGRQIDDDSKPGKKRAETFYDVVEWKKDARPDADRDPRDILSRLHCFTAEHYPVDLNETKVDRSFVKAYEGVGRVVSGFREDRIKYERLEPVINDILKLSDHIAATAKERYNDGDPNRKGGKLLIIDNTVTYFPFLGKESESTLQDAVLYPILFAFRVFLTQDDTGRVSWDRPFPEVKRIWLGMAKRLVELLKEKNEKQRSLTALGKDLELWSDVLRFVIAEKQRIDKDSEIDRLRAKLAALGQTA